MKDMNRTAAAGKEIRKQRPRLDITVGEINQLRDMFTEAAKGCGSSAALWQVIESAYSAGLAVGIRNGAERTERKCAV